MLQLRKKRRNFQKARRGEVLYVCQHRPVSRILMREAVAPIQLTERHELELPAKCGFGQNGNIAASNTENEQ
jgi:hypothetical protein